MHDGQAVDSFAYMFYNVEAEKLDLSAFTTTNAADFSGMFGNCYKLSTINLKNIDTSSVMYMDYMFSNCKMIEDIDLSGFDTSNVNSMTYMFQACMSLKKLDLRAFDFSSITSDEKLAGMFNATCLYNSTGTPIAGYVKTQKVADKLNDSSVTGIFTNMLCFAGDDQTPESVKVTGIKFSGAAVNLYVGSELQYPAVVYPLNATNKNVTYSSSNPDIVSVDSDGLIKTKAVGQATITAVTEDGDYSASYTVYVKETVTDDPEAVSNDFYEYAVVPVEDISSTSITYGYRAGITDAFREQLNKASGGSFTGKAADGNTVTWKTGDPLPDPCPSGIYNNVKVVDMVTMFFNCKEVKSLALSRFTTKNVIRMDGMFSDCINLESINVKNFDTSNVKSFKNMFNNLPSLKSLDVSNFDVSAAENFNEMFANDIKLESINMTGWKTDSATSMAGMFSADFALTGLNLKNFNFSKVSDDNLSEMFNLTSYKNTTGTPYIGISSTAVDRLNDENITGIDTTKLKFYTSEPGTTDNTVTGFVKRLYKLCLNREADNVGLNDWVNKLKSGTKTAAQVVQGFFDSDEFKSKKYSNEEFVTRCYEVMMNREPDEVGKKDWIGKLENGVSRDYVLNGFIGSTEFAGICKNYGVKKGSITLTENRDKNYGITSFVARCYTKTLNRSFDVIGLNDWTGQIMNSAKKKQAAINVASNGFYHSQEFLRKNTSNEEYVKILYSTFLGRTPDSVGLNDWVSQLNKGASRDHVLNGFAYSQEFTKIMASYGIY